MNFEWNEKKRTENLRKHKLDFIEAPFIFDEPMLTTLDTREDYGEDRWVGIGALKGRVVVVVFTERDEGETIRIISLRKALKHERRYYEKEIRNRLGGSGRDGG